MKKKIMAAGALLCAGVMSFSLTACGGDDKDGSAASFVSLDINPSIELVLDKNDKVISAYGANEDGQVLLYQESGIVGESVEKAVEKITSLAVELGYLDENNKVVETSVTSDKADATQKLLDKVNAKVTSTADGLNLSVKCDTEGAYSLLRKLEQVKAEYPENEKIQALTPERFKLVVSATENGEISIEAAVNMDTSKLLEAVSESHKKVEEFATSAYGKIKTEASAAYDKAVGAAVDGIYTTYYTIHHPLNAYYGLSYQSYKFSARSLYAVSDALAFTEKALEYPLNEEQIAQAAIALGLGENVNELKNSDGEITVNSIYAYADKLFKNSAAGAELENLKKQLNTALDGVESEVKQKAEELAKEYEPQLTAVKEQLSGVADKIEGMTAFIPENVKTQVQMMVNDCKELSEETFKIIEDGKVASYEVRVLAKKFEEKAEDMRALIENDLTEKELEEVKQMQADAVEKLSAAKKQMEEALAKAEQQAKTKLEELKAARKAN